MPFLKFSIGLIYRPLMLNFYRYFVFADSAASVELENWQLFKN